MKKILLIIALIFLLPIFSMAMESGCGEDEVPLIGDVIEYCTMPIYNDQKITKINSSIQMVSKLGVKWACDNPTQNDMRYWGSIRITSTIKNKAPVNYIPSLLRVRIYSTAFDRTFSEQSGTALGRSWTVARKVGQARPWVVNGQHTAIINGITYKANTHIPIN